MQNITLALFIWYKLYPNWNCVHVFTHICLLTKAWQTVQLITWLSKWVFLLFMVLPKFSVTSNFCKQGKKLNYDTVKSYMGSRCNVSGHTGAEWPWTSEQVTKEQVSASPSTVCGWWGTKCTQLWGHTPAAALPLCIRGTAGSQSARLLWRTPVWLTHPPVARTHWQECKGERDLDLSFLAIKAFTMLAFQQTQKQQNVTPSVAEPKLWLSLLN